MKAKPQQPIKMLAGDQITAIQFHSIQQLKCKFVPAMLPALEMGLYFGVWAGHAI
jgi:hypothetical protein